MKKYNLSAIMKRAWELVKNAELTISIALQRAWKEAKEMKKTLIDTLTENLNKMAYSDYNINAGIDRQASSKIWEKNGQKRAYLTINCYSAAGRSKGSYKAGYVDMTTNTYVCGKYDDVDAANMVYIGR